MINLNKGKFPIIINPNLGQPLFINLMDYLDKEGKFEKKVIIETLIITIPNQATQEILEYFYSNIFIQPILKDIGKFEERRGEKYLLNLIEIEKIENLDFRDQPILDRESCITWDIFNSVLKIKNVFGKRKELHKIKFEIEIQDIKKILTELKKSGRNFFLFDIIHEVPNMMQNKVNYHSIAIFNKDWKNFNFIHASDFHVARRNDFIIHFLKEKVRSKIAKYQGKEKKLRKINKFILKRSFEFKEEIHEEKYEELRWAKYNFNFNLRMLIEFINSKVMNNNLDFVLMTGDLIDYLNIARGNDQFKNNFEVILEILLGINRDLEKPPYLGKDDELVNKKEILAPIFTIVGNHDYRKGHYGLRFAKIHKIFGMTRSDIKGYNDTNIFNYIFALYSRDKILKDYFRIFNSNLNYKVKIGNRFNFIFLDTGQDSIADMHDLLKGGPSTRGIKDYQIDLLRSYIKLSHDEKVIVVMHTPPISPSLGSSKRRKFKKKFKIKNRSLKWSDFYEENLKKYEETGRLDKVLNLKFETIMYNWATLLKIFTGSDKVVRRKIDLILCGHTHTLKEYRLREAKETERINFGFLFFPIYIEIPCEIYTSNYRKKFNQFDDKEDLKIWFDVNKPFVLQTQAVGPISALYKYKPPGFRYYAIENDQITDAKVYSLHLKNNY